jgi:hypothetical protein
MQIVKITRNQALKINDSISKSNNRKNSSWKSLDLSNMGYLYIVAAIFPVGWIYLLLTNWGYVVKFTSLPVLGWALAAIWILMVLSIPNLLYIGISLIKLSRNPEVLIAQTVGDQRRQKMIAVLLVLGIIADIVAIPICLFYIPDKSAAIFFSGLMGGRIIQANYEAIMQYHNL